MNGLEIIHKNGQPYGIRDNGGYLLFFPKVTKYQGQEQRYIDEIAASFDLAQNILKHLEE